MPLESKLYDGKVVVHLAEETHRYQVSVDGGPFATKRGVNTILSTLSKPGLMLWPMDEALKHLFGQKFEEIYGEDETKVRPVYDPHLAAIKPLSEFTVAHLQTLLEDARSAHSKKRDKGADTGQVAHGLIETYLLVQSGEVEPDVLPLAADLDASDLEALKSYEAFVKWYESQSGIKTLEAERVVYSKVWDYCGTADALLKINGKLVWTDVKTSNYSRTAPLGIYADNFIQLGAYALAYGEETGEYPDDLLALGCSKQGKVSPVYASALGLSVNQCMDMWRHTLALWRGREELGKELRKLKRPEMVGKEASHGK